MHAQTGWNGSFDHLKGVFCACLRAVFQGFGDFPRNHPLVFPDFLELINGQSHACSHCPETQQRSFQGGSHRTGRQDHRKRDVVAQVDATDDQVRFPSEQMAAGQVHAVRRSTVQGIGQGRKAFDFFGDEFGMAGNGMSDPASFPVRGRVTTSKLLTNSLTRT